MSSFFRPASAEWTRPFKVRTDNKFGLLENLTDILDDQDVEKSTCIQPPTKVGSHPKWAAAPCAPTVSTMCQDSSSVIKSNEQLNLLPTSLSTGGQPLWDAAHCAPVGVTDAEEKNHMYKTPN